MRSLRELPESPRRVVRRGGASVDSPEKLQRNPYRTSAGLHCRHPSLSVSGAGVTSYWVYTARLDAKI